MVLDHELDEKKEGDVNSNDVMMQLNRLEKS